MEEKYLNKNKIYYRIHYLSDKKRTLFFVHGLSGSSSAWKKYEKKYEKKYNLISIDLRGHGKSFRPNKINDYKIKSFVSDLYKLIKKEKVKKVIFIAHSFGNFPVIEFIKKYPHKVIGAVLVSPNFNPSSTLIAKIMRPLLKIKYLFNYLPNKKNKRHINYEKYINTGDWNIRRSYADIKNTGLKSYLSSSVHSYSWNAEAFIDKIKIPILIIHGRKDTIFPVKNTEYISKKIKNAELKVLENANHIIVLNFFKELSSLIEKFVKNLPKTAN